jgi:hypothetical protein
MNSLQTFKEASTVKCEGFYAAVAYTSEVFKLKSGRITNFLMTHANREIPSEEIETSVCRIIPNFINLYI